MAERDENIRQARVYLTEARNRRARRADRNFYWSLLNWAARCRRRAAACITKPPQGDLFA
jgi:hypothetical protein